MGSRGAGAGLRKPRREGWRGCRPIGATSPRIRHGIPDVGPAHMSCEGDRRLRTGRVFAGRGSRAPPQHDAPRRTSRRQKAVAPSATRNCIPTSRQSRSASWVSIRMPLGSPWAASARALLPPLPEGFRTLPWQRQPSARRFRPLTGGTHRLRPQCPGLPHSGRKRCENGPSVAPQGVCTAEKQGATPITRWWMLLNLAGLRSSCAQSADTTRARAVRRRRGLSKQPQRTRVSGRALRGSARRPGPEGPAGPRERPGR